MTCGNLVPQLGIELGTLGSDSRSPIQEFLSCMASIESYLAALLSFILIIMTVADTLNHLPISFLLLPH